MKKLLFSFVLLFCCVSIALAQDTSMARKIREEGLMHSQVADIAHHLTNVAGPRLTNSPGYKRASDWVVTTLKKWGLQNAKLEPWGEFGPGWEIEKSYVAMKAPYYHQLIAYPVAWTTGTKAPLTSTVVELKTLDSATIASMASQIKGKIVLLGENSVGLRSAFEPYAKRYSDSELVHMKNLFWVTREMLDMYEKVEKKQKQLDSMLDAKGPALIIRKDYGGRDGSVYADAMESYKKNAVHKIPKVIVSTEDYMRIRKLIKEGTPVQLEADIRNKFYNTDLKGYNPTAEIPGTDPALKDELVIVGGHLDSWYSGTGATDNAAGCAVMMEVIRILKSLNIQPRRTIRIVLWGGEEQGLIGSFNYVRNHFAYTGTMELKPEHSKVSAYYNLDNGSGKVRGIFAQSNEAVKPIFQEWFKPFNDLGATEVTLSNTSSTDHISFDEVGIPGFQFIQDPLEYLSRTHHSNVDTYEHLSIDDLKQAATVIAYFVYNTAMRDEKLPRKPLPAPHRFVFEGF